MTLTLTELLGGYAFGVVSHLCFYIHREHHMKAPTIFWSHVALLLSLVYCKAYLSSCDLAFALRDSFLVFTSYLCGLLISIGIYRNFFHRLRNFPGPLAFRTTKIWHALKAINSQNHLILDKLHQEYGDFVRTGPEEITVFSPEVKWALDGPYNNCTKAVWYDILLPMVALNTSRDKNQHDQRRRIWDQAVTKKRLQIYQSRIKEYGEKFERHIASISGAPIDITQWFYFLSFDVMGDFAFAKTFNMIDSQEWHHTVRVLRRALSLLGPVSPVPWLAQLAFSLPVLPVIRDWNNMIRWCAQRMGEQINVHTNRPNISTSLIRGSLLKKSLVEDKLFLEGDSVALVVAGSETVASTLTCLFYRLALHPQHAEQIREEIKSVESIHDIDNLSTLKHFNGTINEVLRLHPSVPTGGYRQTPPEGLKIEDVWIPGNVTIVAPRYTIGRLERSYKFAEEFIPERWYSKPDLAINKKSFTPFSIGRYSCIGKNIALAEIRFVTALLLSKYSITFAPGEDGTSMWKNMKDQFTANPGALKLVFEPLG